MEVVDIHAGNETHFPFNQPSGPRSPAIGPVIKRTQSKVKIAPTDVIAESTLRHFEKIGIEDFPWSPFYSEAHDILSRPSLSWNSQIYTGDHPTAYQAAINVIDENETVFLSIETANGKRPGQFPEYAACLQSILAETKYATKTAPALPDSICALTGITSTCYANGLAGARLNITNVDRAGAFPGVDTDDAGKRFAISRQACDLLYIFKFHILPDLQGYVGGSKALILPTFINRDRSQKFYNAYIGYVGEIAKKEIVATEDRLGRIFLGDSHIPDGLHLIWATFGQKMEDITFQLNDVLPSRMKRIQTEWNKFKREPSPFAPEYPVDYFQQDAWLNAPYALYKRPGGKAAKTVNSDRLRDFVQYLLVHIYRGTPITQPDRLTTEALDVARHYHRDMLADGDDYGLLNEGYSKKKNKAFPTLAGFMLAHQQFYQFLIHLDLMQSTVPPDIQLDVLQSYFTEDSGLDSEDKAAAFILGILFGRLLTIQSIRGVNVAANALTVVKNYQMHPRDVADIYSRIVGKLQQYHDDPNGRIKREHRELKDHLVDEYVSASKQGRPSTLTQPEFNYYFLLGQAVNRRLFIYEKKTQTKGDK